MFTPKRLIRSALISIWFMILVFPIVGIRIIKRAPEFFYDRVLVIGAITFVLAVLWSWYFEVYKDRDLSKGISSQVSRKFSALSEKITNDKNTALKLILVLFIVFMILPVFTSMYQTTVYSLAFLYVMLALGLNIVVGIAGQLVLGYAAFLRCRCVYVRLIEPIPRLGILDMSAHSRLYHRYRGLASRFSGAQAPRGLFGDCHLGIW